MGGDTVRTAIPREWMGEMKWHDGGDHMSPRTPYKNGIAGPCTPRIDLRRILLSLCVRDR